MTDIGQDFLDDFNNMYKAFLIKSNGENIKDDLILTIVADLEYYNSELKKEV